MMVERMQKEFAVNGKEPKILEGVLITLFVKRTHHLE